MRDAMITYLKDLNRCADASTVATRLYYNEGRDFVQDLSFFANEDYMSEGLLNAIRNGQTLTSAQESELQMYIIEKAI